MLFTIFHVLVVNLPISEKLSEHSLNEQNNMQLVQTQPLKDNLNLFSINNLILNDVNMQEFKLNLIRQYKRIIDPSNNWFILLLK